MGAAAYRLARLIVLVGAALSVHKALFGPKGLLEVIRLRRQGAELTESLERLRRENAALRERARRLREDPRAIEEVARRELGLRRPGEVIVIVRDKGRREVAPADAEARGEAGVR